MKKCFAILAFLCLLLLPACANKSSTNSQLHSSNSVASDSSSKIYSEGESPIITVPNGQYSVTIDSVEESTDRNDIAESQPKRIVLINYTYKNISYKRSFMIDDMNFHVYGANGTQLKPYPSIDQRLPGHPLPVGKQLSASVSYGLEDNSKKIRIDLYDRTFNRTKSFATYSCNIK